MQGWIKLHRKIIECGFFNNPSLSHFWVWCLLKASHEEYEAIIKYQKIPLNPGQFIFGRMKAAEETGLSEQKVRTCTQFLLELGNITIKPTNKFSIITITKWDTYQKYDIENNQLDNQQITNKEPTNNHIQEHKEDKEYNIPPVSTEEKDKLTKRFGAFWKLYPKHEGKKDALRHFKATVKTDKDWEDFKKATENYLKKIKLEQTDKQFIKQASTYVNSWSDWLEVEVISEPKRRML